MSHGNISIRSFIEEISKGDYVIPHFQRDFDWQPNMVNDLFKSILHNYYAGTILLWALEDSERKLKMWDPLWGSEKSESPTKAILDGQQRLSSIFYALFAPKKKFPNKTTYYYFFIDLNETFSGNEDESIIYWYYKTYKDKKFFKSERGELIEDGYFPLCLLSDEDFLRSQGYQDWITEYVDKKKRDGVLSEDITSLSVSEKIKSILSYPFLTETLEKKEVKEICTIFANINSKGLRLDIFDLMNAFLYPKGIQLRKDWDNVDNEALKDVDSQMKVYLLKLISLFKQKYCSSKYLYNLIPGSTIKDRKGNKSILVSDNQEFQQLWGSSIKFSEKARSKIMSSGINDFGAIKNTFIPNTTIIPVLGALMLNYEKNLSRIISENAFWEKIRKWYWCAVVSGDYSGSSDSVMAKDYKEVVEWLKDDRKIPDRVEKITSVFIEESLDLEKVRNTNSSQYCTILNLLAINSAKDLFTGRMLGNYPIKDINDHHIFPVKCGLNIRESKIDSILNRTLLWKETNNKIKNKKPSEYYGDIVQIFKDEPKVEDLMKTHLISPKALKCLKSDDFEGFVKERELTIKDELKRIIGIREKREDSSVIAPGKHYDNEINYISYIEDCEEFVNIIDPYFRENSIRLIRKGLVNNKSVKNIKIITKPDALDNAFKESFKNFFKQLKEEGIDVELRVLTEPKIQTQIHNRYLITKNKSFDFVSADTVKRGQLSHIKEVADVMPIFIDFWEKGRELINNWDMIIRTKEEKQKRIVEMNKE